MSLGRKILFLLLVLVILITYSVSTFGYKTILSNTQIKETSFSSEDSMFGEYADLVMLRINELKSIIIENLELDEGYNSIENKAPIDLELIKENGMVSMNGTFKDEEQAKSIVELLNINRSGEYKFDEHRVKNVVLLNKLSLLMDSFKEFFNDGSKLAIEDGKVLLNGELKDSNFKPLLDSIIVKSNLDIITDIKEPFKSKTEKIIENIKKTSVPVLKQFSSESEDKLNKLEKITSKKEDSEPVSQLVQEAQKSINNLTSNNKITFKSRSTNISEKSKEAIKEIASILLDNSKLKVKIEGHTDSSGESSLNKKISQDRANSVKTALMSLGVNPKQITAVGYGEDFPIAEDDANGLSELNRRVEFIVGETK